MAKQNKRKNEKGENVMNIKIIEYILQAIKTIIEVCDKVVDASDPQKYAEGVHALNQNVEETYAKMRELILADERLTSEEKVEKLDKLAKSQQEALKACGDEIKNNRAHMAKIVTEVFAALATCGVSCIPKVIGGRKKIVASTGNDVVVESDALAGYIEAENIASAD